MQLPTPARAHTSSRGACGLQRRTRRPCGPGTPQWTVALSGAAIGTVALLARLLPVLRGGGLGGIPGYDDGVYFGAAESFVFGRIPYRDFVLLHPPGIVLVLAPFAELARWTTDIRGLAAAQLAFMCVGAANAVLVYLVARRIGTPAGVVGGLFYAFWAAATWAERTALLEPLVNLGLLVGLLCLGDMRTTSRRRTLVGGAALGLACSVKIWAVVPLLVLALWVLGRAGLRRALTLLAGSVAAAGLICLPFFLAAPDRMLRLVVFDQATTTVSARRARAGDAVASPTAGATTAVSSCLARADQIHQIHAAQIHGAGLAKTSRTTTCPAPSTADPALSVEARTDTAAHWADTRRACISRSTVGMR